MRIHKEGHAIIIVVLLILFIINEMCWIYLSPIVFHCILVPSIGFAVLVVSFFRNPIKRPKTIDEDGVIAPADGKIVAVEEVYEPEVLKCNCLQISIFMSIYNIHKNFFPVSGEVVHYSHHSGNYHRAVLPKSSLENERSSVVVKNKKGIDILCRQVAGALARRVVSYVEKGQIVEQSNEMGFIKFGSRVDVFLPIDAEPMVKIGDRTIGSQTLLAKLK